MKKLLSLILTVCIVISLATPTTTMGSTTTTDITYFEDGSYIVTEIESFSFARATIVEGTKTYTFFTGDDIARWALVCRGKFRFVPGEEVACVEASSHASIYDSTWDVYNIVDYPYLNTAVAKADAMKYYQGQAIWTTRCNIVLECDEWGNLR